MKAEVSKDKKTITLPVPLGSAVFILVDKGYDGYVAELREYTFDYLGHDIYATREEAEASIRWKV